MRGPDRERLGEKSRTGEVTANTVLGAKKKGGSANWRREFEPRCVARACPFAQQQKSAVRRWMLLARRERVARLSGPVLLLQRDQGEAARPAHPGCHLSHPAKDEVERQAIDGVLSGGVRTTRRAWLQAARCTAREDRDRQTLCGEVLHSCCLGGAE